MKKIFFTLGIALVTLSCNFENVPTETVSETKSSVMKMSEMKTPEMKAFDQAFRSLGNPENRPTAEERKSGTTELSDRRKKLLLPASISLIKSTSITDGEIQRKTNGDMTAIIVWAIEINLKKNKQIKTNSQN